MLPAPDAITSLASGLGIGGGLALGLQFMKWLLTFAASRQDKQQEHIDAGIRELIDGLRTEVDRLKAGQIRLEEELAECNRKHLESDAEVNRLRAQLERYVADEKGKAK